jgi:hypothetical protein
MAFSLTMTQTPILPRSSLAFWRLVWVASQLKKAIQPIEIRPSGKRMAMGAFQTVLLHFFGREFCHASTFASMPFNSVFARAVGFANTIAVSGAVAAVAYSAGFWSTEQSVVLALSPSLDSTAIVTVLAQPEHFGKYEGALALALAWHRRRVGEARARDRIINSCGGCWAFRVASVIETEMD